MDAPTTRRPDEPAPRRRSRRVAVALGAASLLGVLAGLAVAGAGGRLSAAIAGWTGPAPHDGSVGARLVRESGAEAHVRGVGAALRAAAARHDERTTDERTERVLDAAWTSGEPEALVAEARRRLIGPGDAESARQALGFFDSPLGRRMREIERAAEGEIDDGGLSDYIDELFTRPVDLERVRLLERLDEASGGAVLTADVEALAERALARALHDARPDRGAGDALAVELERIEARRQQSLALWRAQSSILLQYVYRDATDAELAAYVAFAESDRGRWLADATARALADLEPWLDARLRGGADARAR